jgi:hypothetical protein
MSSDDVELAVALSVEFVVPLWARSPRRESLSEEIARPQLVDARIRSALNRKRAIIYVVLGHK